MLPSWRPVAGSYFIDHARKSGNRRLDDEFADGYNEAANISVEILAKTIGDLQKRAASGDFLSEHEQFLSGKLYELKADMEKALYDFWEQGGPSSVRADERP
ncbi:hypothetical protein [Kitasatospora sp. NPDC094016]|uniref:hypothetical protein n=1 Tax=Kitasatospora sp. NPDC094016 TaxID=3154986 RepID=UPI003320D365